MSSTSKRDLTNEEKTTRRIANRHTSSYVKYWPVFRLLHDHLVKDVSHIVMSYASRVLVRSTLDNYVTVERDAEFHRFDCTTNTYRHHTRIQSFPVWCSYTDNSREKTAYAMIDLHRWYGYFPPSADIHEFIPQPELQLASSTSFYEHTRSEFRPLTSLGYRSMFEAGWWLIQDHDRYMRHLQAVVDELECSITMLHVGISRHVKERQDCRYLTNQVDLISETRDFIISDIEDMQRRVRENDGKYGPVRKRETPRDARRAARVQERDYSERLRSAANHSSTPHAKSLMLALLRDCDGKEKGFKFRRESLFWLISRSRFHACKCWKMMTPPVECLMSAPRALPSQ
jgi:hypothetical protein